MSRIEKIREEWKARQLKLKNLPASDLDDQGRQKPDEEKYKNIQKRLEHLAEVLCVLYKLYKQNELLYGDQFLAFVGDKVVRGWPRKDFPFQSQAASTASKEKLHCEHWTPISFFRDLFNENDLTKDDFYEALLKYYRVVWITKDENTCLNNEGFKTTRPINAYSHCKIVISDSELWKKLYGDNPND